MKVGEKNHWSTEAPFFPKPTPNKKERMQPLHAIVYSTVGALLLAVLASSITADGKPVAPPAMCGAFEEAAYMCNLPKQDRTPSAALLHCATGEGMLLAARRLVSDEAIVHRCGIDPQRIQQRCAAYKAEALKAMAKTSKVRVR